LFNNTVAQDGVLHITNVTRYHVGSYMCTAYTSYGILKAISGLHIKEPPTFTLKPRSLLRVKQGSAVRLCCEAAGSPRPKIEWSRAQSSPNSLLPFQQNGCLTIKTVKEKSEGDYVCRAANSYGVTQTATTVIVTSWC